MVVLLDLRVLLQILDDLLILLDLSFQALDVSGIDPHSPGLSVKKSPQSLALLHIEGQLSLKLLDLCEFESLLELSELPIFGSKHFRHIFHLRLK